LHCRNESARKFRERANPYIQINVFPIGAAGVSEILKSTSAFPHLLKVCAEGMSLQNVSDSDETDAWHKDSAE
jgi:hypothetical protein